MPRDYGKIALTEAARAELLEEADAMRFASVGADGLPHVVPVAFCELDGTVYFETDADAVKTRNVRATGKAAAVVDLGADDYSQHRGLQWRGDAFVVEDRETEKAVERALFGTEKSVSDAGGHERVKIGLEPTREVSWDF
ncbi:MAG: pyridoxamine 5'-phosphate oxidase family protein, partial [Halobacteriales archaeon]|nr:pyridoxamine 5'-phosphate oxidase family protein [Halobacteriales archaeon]